MKILFVISSFLTIAVAQQPSISCNYAQFGEAYGCELIINNPDGLNDFTAIGGIHLEGFTNADVDILFHSNAVSANLPRIICDTFPNITQFSLYNIGLTEIDDSAFSGCSRVIDIELTANRISSISANAFITLLDLRYLILNSNSLRTLPENLLANQQRLTRLDLTFNPIEEIPVNFFRPLESLEFLYLGYTNLNAINNQWLIHNTNLFYLYLANNRLTLSADSFVGLNAVRFLELSNNAISAIPVGTFVGLPSLQDLFLNGNNFTELQADSFPDLGQLEYLDINSNPIQVIHDGAFRGLGSLTSLHMSDCGLRQLEAHSFEDLRNLTFINLNFNEIEEIHPGVFAQSPSLNYIGLWNNRLKTLRRNIFGTLTSLESLDLEGNIVNALDRAIIDDAASLDTLYFNGNLCASNYFGNFINSRTQYLAILDRCFTNFRFIVDTTTESGDDFAFFEGPNPGIALRVNTDNEVQIALTPFNFIWRPTIEILIGTTNNTRSVIRVNQETNVVTVPTPNIIQQNQWNDFRVTYANQVVQVYNGNNTFPFMAYTMQDFFPVNFYGLRAVETRATWSVQPFE